jgi:hypothetical protein
MDARIGSAPHLELADSLGQLADEGVVQAVLDQDAGGGGAGFALVVETPFEGIPDGSVQVGVVENDEGVLAAELHDGRGDVLRRGGRDGSAGAGGTSE